MDRRRIAGHTKIMLPMADPVSSAVSTEAVTAFMRSSGHDFVCVPDHIGADGLPAMIDVPSGFRNRVGSGIALVSSHVRRQGR